MALIVEAQSSAGFIGERPRRANTSPTREVAEGRTSWPGYDLPFDRSRRRAVHHRRLGGAELEIQLTIAETEALPFWTTTGALTAFLMLT